MPDPIDLGIPGLVEAVEVGRGGFAVVYRTRQPDFDREVAVKVLTAAPDPTSLARFQREVRAMGKLSEHPAIATVLDAGTTSDGRAYLLMTYLSGGSLQDAIDAGVRMSGQEAAALGVLLAGAIEAAHAEGILHRDIKPANVMRGRYGDPLLVDFGIARIVGGHETTTGVVTATLTHAAPELLDGKSPTVASDVYALGSTLYALITGRPAFAEPTDESVIPLIRRILLDPVPDLREHGVTPPIAEVVERAMAKDPDDRFPTAAEVCAALRRAAHDPQPTGTGSAEGRGTTPTPTRNARTGPAAPPQPTDDSGVPDTPRRPGRSAVLAGGIGVVLLVVIGASMLSRGGDPGGQDTVEQPTSTVAETGTTPGAPGDALLRGIDEFELSRLAAVVTRGQIQSGDVVELEVPVGGSTALEFSLTEPAAVRVVTSAIDGGDPYGGLYRGDVLLLGDDDTGEESEVLLDHPGLPAGDYELRLSAHANAAQVLVSLRAPVVQRLDRPIDARLDDVHDVDAFVVDIVPGGAIGVVASSTDEIELRAYTPDGELVGGTSGFGDDLPIDLVDAGPGPVIVMVAPMQDVATYAIRPLMGPGS